MMSDSFSRQRQVDILNVIVYLCVLGVGDLRASMGRYGRFKHGSRKGILSVVAESSRNCLGGKFIFVEVYF